MPKKEQIKTLDLHGKSTSEVFDLVDRFLSQQSLSKARRCKIMPGKGTGKVKALVIDYLSKAGYPWEYETINNKPNQGVLIVFMD